MKILFLILPSLLLLLNDSAISSTILNKPKNIPQKVSFTLALEDLPGSKESESFWEASYDWRIADMKEYKEKSRLQDDVVILGDILAKSSITFRNLKQANNRMLHVKVPVEGVLARRLRAESENPQIFLLRANFRIYDAKLNKTIIHQINRAWEFKLFPDGNASISIKVRENGGFSIWGPTIKTVPPGYKIISGSSSSSPPALKNKKQKTTSKSKKRIKSKSN